MSTATINVEQLVTMLAELDDGTPEHSQPPSHPDGRMDSDGPR